MSALGLFALGAVVTVIVSAALTLLIWGAILDGREEQERRETEAERDAPPIDSAPSLRRMPAPAPVDNPAA